MQSRAAKRRGPAQVDPLFHPPQQIAVFPAHQIILCCSKSFCAQVSMILMFLQTNSGVGSPRGAVWLAAYTTEYTYTAIMQSTNNRISDLPR